MRLLKSNFKFSFDLCVSSKICSTNKLCVMSYVVKSKLKLFLSTLSPLCIDGFDKLLVGRFCENFQFGTLDLRNFGHTRSNNR